ncbi:NUDIX domain-containing protein [Streptomyces sioyaensis]|uniref:NUDIX domain-containing protein n=1 Tax=Streptomyces sioyaensis TaxID=67364 RepID=UPI0037997A6A
MIRRALPPGRGRLALPWGYLKVGESWREAAVRELREETGLMASAHGPDTPRPWPLPWPDARCSPP